MWLGRKFWIWIDKGVIDRFGPDGAAWIVAQGTVGAKRIQSGFLNTYALWMLVGLIGAVTWVLL
jgi:NADH-quinone oxidoreductase subunit L